MARIYNNIVETVGHTPLVKLNKVTEGVDATISYPTDFGDKGLVNWTMAGNFNETSIGRIDPVPAVLLGELGRRLLQFWHPVWLHPQYAQHEDRADGGLVTG